MIRNQSKASFIAVAPATRLDLNPFAQAQGSARIVRNFVPERGRLARKAFSPKFTTLPSTASGRVWDVVNFRYTRAGAAENRVLIFRSDGKVYLRQPSYDQEIFPAATGFSVLTKRPFVGQVSNRLGFSDGISSYIYDGRDVQVWGLTRSTTAPAVSAVAGSLTAATGLKASITWVVLDETGARVHESSRSNVSAFQVLSAENLRVDITALSPPARATHWSAYVSELDGSEIRRRVATTRITTLTVDVSALPSATSPKEPIRNDPPPPTTVGEVAANRYIVRKESAPHEFWFSALGEVKGLLNGAADESFCGQHADTVSDVSNSDFVTDRELRAIREYENVRFLFTERRGFALIGELSLLDNVSPRSLVKLNQFSEGCVGPHGALATPYGLTWMSPGRRLWLWSGGQGLLDIGEPIQSALDTIPPNELGNIYMYWWDGNGRQWLIVCLHCANGETGASLANRCLIFDFSRPARRPDRDADPGSWFEWTDITATCAGTYQDNDGHKTLLVGDTSGDVYQADVVCSPAHFARSLILGQTYWGSTVQNNPAATLRTGLLIPNPDSWSVGQYIALVSGDQNAPGVPAVGTFSEPTLGSWIDVEDVGTPGTAITLTLDTALTSADKRAWLQPQSAGNTNIGGALAKQFLFQADYAAGTNTTGNADGRETARINTLYKVAFAFSPLKESTL